MAKSSSSNTSEIIKTIQNYNDSIYSSKLLVQPMMSLFTESRFVENADEVCMFTAHRDATDSVRRSLILDLPC
jgi:hypothetical protein